MTLIVPLILILTFFLGIAKESGFIMTISIIGYVIYCFVCIIIAITSVRSQNAKFYQNQPDFETNSTEESQTVYPWEEDEKRKKNRATIIALLILLLCSLGYMIVSNTNLFSFFSDNQDKKEIKQKIEETYYGIMNGKLTAYNLSELTLSDMPFYNTNLESLLSMELGAFGEVFGGVNLEPININVYQISDDSTAKAKYDLIISTPSSRDTFNIDITARKIGGIWKLNAEDFFSIYNINKKKDQSNKKQLSRISKKVLFKITEDYLFDYAPRNIKYEPIEGSKISQLLNNRLLEEYRLNNERYKIYDLREFSYKEYTLKIFVVADNEDLISFVVMNVCDYDGNIIDSSEIANLQFDIDAENYYDISTCVFNDNGEFIIQKVKHEGDLVIKDAERVFLINDQGRIIEKQTESLLKDKKVY